MDLNLDALANAIIEEYKRRTGDEKLVESFISSVEASGTYSDVYKLAKKAGLNLEQTIIDKWTFGADEVYFSTMKDLLKKTAGPMHDDIARACLFIQDKMNKAAGIKLKSQFAPINEYDLGDIAERMKNQGITKLMGELQTLGCKMVDDNQQANMELQTSAGYEIVVSRKYDSIGLRSGTKYAERCKICIGLEGTHQFKSTREARSSGVFARHPGCGCVIDYYSKRTGTVSKSIQNYNTGKKTKNNKASKNDEVKQNIENNKLKKQARKIDESKLLTNREETAILQYKSFESYKINDLLRTVEDISKLNPEDRLFINSLDSALTKIEKYEGNLVRTIDFSRFKDQEDIDNFLTSHSKGKVIKYSQYISTSKQMGYNGSADVNIFIQNSKNGRDISKYGVNENEVLYERNSSFVVLNQIQMDDKWFILLEELE